MSVGAHADAAPIPALLNTIAVAIMAKAPWPGAVKTRLCPPLLAAEAAELYRCFLLDKISAVQALVGARPVVAFTPDEAQAEFAALAPDFTLVPQRGPDLGARLYATLASLLEAGHPGAIAVDSDTPTLPREFLQQAIDCLSRPGPDVVLGPTDDGGYYLIGVRAAHRALFDGVPWSTSAVLEITLRQAAAAGLQTVCMPAWFDVDTPDDLRRLETVLDGSPPAKETGQTGRFLASLRR
jgi:rSAM/selenodomain-associated transferase 1